MRRVLRRTIEIADKLANAEIKTGKTGLSAAFSLTILTFAASVASFALGYNVAGVALVAFSVLMFIRSLFGGDRGRIGGPDR